SLNLVSKVGSYTYNLSTTIPNIFFLIIIYFISIYLFSFQLENINKTFLRFFKDSSKRKVLIILNDLRSATIGFLKAQIILSTVTYLISFIGLTILNVRYAFVIAFFIVLVDILPILGVGSFFTPWAIISAIQGNLLFAFSLVILFVIIVIVRRIIEPKILGERIGLSALTTLISIWVGFKVMGIVGIFLLPLACIFYKALIKVNVIKLNFKI
ncbi:MAG: sporulation integral membrane protein YtvI, partial [Eubacteriales bacterium]